MNVKFTRQETRDPRLTDYVNLLLDSNFGKPANMNTYEDIMGSIQKLFDEARIPIKTSITNEGSVVNADIKVISQVHP